MDPDGWIGIEELENTLGFMCAQVIGHEVNFSALSRLAMVWPKKSTNRTGMPSGGFSQGVAGASVQGGIQLEGAMSELFKPMPFGFPRESGKTGSSRSRAWIAGLFIDTEGPPR